MRIILEMKALDDQVTNQMDYHKIQGFVYNVIHSSMLFKNLHDVQCYKFFNYSNIFPSTLAKSGDYRCLILASPNKDLIMSIFGTYYILQLRKTHIGTQSFQILSAKLFRIEISGNTCTLNTATPVTARIPEKNYTLCDISIQHRKEKFLYWRKYLPSDIFVRLVEDNLEGNTFHSFDNKK